MHFVFVLPNQETHSVLPFHSGRGAHTCKKARPELDTFGGTGPTARIPLRFRLSSRHLDNHHLSPRRSRRYSETRFQLGHILTSRRKIRLKTYQFVHRLILNQAGFPPLGTGFTDFQASPKPASHRLGLASLTFKYLAKLRKLIPSRSRICFNSLVVSSLCLVR